MSGLSLAVKPEPFGKASGMDRPTFGARIKTLRTAKGLSRQEFGDAVGVGPRIVESWEQGLRAPKLPQLPLVADVLGCTLDDLLRDEPTKPKRKPPKS